MSADGSGGAGGGQMQFDKVDLIAPAEARSCPICKLPITDEYRAYAEQVTTRLYDAGLRVHLDARSETLKYRIAEGARMKFFSATKF